MLAVLCLPTSFIEDVGGGGDEGEGEGEGLGIGSGLGQSAGWAAGGGWAADLLGRMVSLLRRLSWSKS